MKRCGCAFLVLLAGCGARTPFDGAQSDGVVRGTVIDEAGYPFAGAKIRIDATSTVTDGQGRFSVPASAIYDAAIVVHGKGYFGATFDEGHVYAYQGMSRRDPVFKTSGRFAPSSPTHNANLSINGPRSPSGSVRTIRALQGDSRYGIFASTVDANLKYREFAMWAGSETINLELYAFQCQIDPMTDAPVHYLAFDKLEKSLSPGEVDWRFDWNWKPMPYREATITAAVRLPDGYRISSTDIHVQPQSTLVAYSFLGTPHSGTELTFVVPDLPGAAYSLRVMAYNGARFTERTIDLLTPSSPAAPLELEEAPRAVSPAEGASGIGFDTEFTWENPAHGVRFVMVVPSGTSHLATYQLFTNGTSARIPDVSDLGIAFPSQAEYEWATFVVTSDSVDQLAPHGIDNTDFRERTYAATEYRKLTTR
jgi:hypothetical protein